jgi:hypothetical protein
MSSTGATADGFDRQFGIGRAGDAPCQLIGNVEALCQSIDPGRVFIGKIPSGPRVATAVRRVGSVPAPARCPPGISPRQPWACYKDHLWRLQSENHSPHPMNLSTALLAFREEVERGSIRGLEWEFPRAIDGTICMFNMYEFALMDISFRAADVLRTWPDWPATLAWNAAKTRPWQALILKVWIRSLPAGDYLPFADVVDLVAFGRAKMAIGLSDIDEHAVQLRAGIAIINAAIESRIKLAAGKRVVARNVARQRVGLAGAEDRLDHAPNGIIVELCSGADYAGVAHGNRSVPGQPAKSS